MAAIFVFGGLSAITFLCLCTGTAAGTPVPPLTACFQNLAKICKEPVSQMPCGHCCSVWSRFANCMDSRVSLAQPSCTVDVGRTIAPFASLVRSLQGATARRR